MSMESDARARETINNHLNNDFEEKFEIVRPALEKRGLLGSATQESMTQTIKQREENEAPQIEAARQEAIESSVQQDAGHVRSKTIETEMQMFSPAKMKDRAQNRMQFMEKPASQPNANETRAKNVLQMIENGKLNTPEKKAQNIMNFNQRINDRNQEKQERKTRAQKLVAWWKSLDKQS